MFVLVRYNEFTFYIMGVYSTFKMAKAKAKSLKKSDVEQNRAKDFQYCIEEFVIDA